MINYFYGKSKTFYLTVFILKTAFIIIKMKETIVQNLLNVSMLQIISLSCLMNIYL